MADTIQCSAAQSEAITHGAGPMLVLAGPGSGKTFVITRRIQYLIEQEHVKPEQILVITFTKAAAGEMRERFLKLTHEKFYPVTFGTFHAFFFQILKQTYHFDTSSILREKEKKMILAHIMHDIPAEMINDNSIINTIVSESSHCDEEENEDVLQRLISEISKVKNLRLPFSDFESSLCSKEVFAYLYREYDKEIRRRHKIDFDDMVLLCLKLLNERPDVLELWQERFTYILIDEFQDISPAQYEAVRLLAARYHNLFIVGDDDQSIYGFRGSDPELMLRFKKDYPEAKQVLLDMNYRSRQDIVSYSSNLISHNHNRYPKNVHAADITSGGVRSFSFDSKEDEICNIVELIRQYMQQENVHYSDIALIFRTNTNAMMAADKLIHENIPFQMKEKPKNIYESTVAKDIAAYIRYAMYENDVASFYRIMNRPSRYIRRDSVPVRPFTMQELLYQNQNKDYVIHNVISLYDQLHFLKKLNPYAAINYIRHGIGYDDFLIEQAKKAGSNPATQIGELDELQERAACFNTLQEWLYHIEHYEENMQRAQEMAVDAVQIVTMHASKGLEWKLVLLPDLNEGIVPHKKAVSETEIEEERRMFYVAMTRARENLFLFYVKEKTGGKILPSRFLTELQCRAASDSAAP